MKEEISEYPGPEPREKLLKALKEISMHPDFARIQFVPSGYGPGGPLLSTRVNLVIREDDPPEVTQKAIKEAYFKVKEILEERDKSLFHYLKIGVEENNFKNTCN